MRPQLSCLDRFFLELESASRGAHWALVVELTADRASESLSNTEPLDIDALRARVHERINTYPIFRLGVVGGRWRQPTLREYTLDEALSCVTSVSVDNERQFRNLLSDLLAQPLTRDRPSWRVVLIDQLRPRAQRLVLLVHHSMSDGVAGAGYTALFADGDDTKLQHLDRFVRTERYPAPPVPMKVFLPAAHAFVSSWAGGRRSQRLPKLSKGGRRAVSTLQLSTAKVRRAAAAFNSGTSEFLVAAIGAGLTDSLRAAMPEHQRPATLRAYVPITLDSELRHTGNAVSMALINLPGGQPSLEQRIASARQELTGIAETGAAFALAALARMSATTPWAAQCAASRATMAIMAPDLHLGINPSYVKLDAVLGYQVAALHPLSPLLGNVLSFTCQVVASAVYIGIVWDPDALGEDLGSTIAQRVAELLPSQGQLIGDSRAQS